MRGDVHNGPTSKTGPQRSSHSAPLLPQVLVSSQSHSFPPSGSSGSEKGLDQVFLWVGMEERGKPLRAARGWQHERPYSSQEQGRPMGVCGLGEKVTGWIYTGYRQSPKIKRLQI